MIKQFKDIEKILKKKDEKVTIILVAAHDKEPLISISKAVKKSLCKAILVGNKRKINSILKDIGVSSKLFEIYDAKTDEAILDKAFEMLKKREHSILMKGLISTATFMKKVLSKEANLRTGRTISHGFVFENPYSKKLTIITDGGIVPHPTYEQRKEILENALLLAKSFNIKKVKVAMISGSEKISDKIPATIDFDNLKKEFKNRNDLIIDGPFGIDVAITKKSAKHKGIETKVSQIADIWLVPSMEAGNMAAKSILYYGKVNAGGVILGAKLPIILLSRADDSKTKYNSILLGLIAYGSVR